MPRSSRARTDRPTVMIVIPEDEAQELARALAAGSQPVWVRRATDCIRMGSEADYRASMGADVG